MTSDEGLVVPPEDRAAKPRLSFTSGLKRSIERIDVMLGEMKRQQRRSVK
jgi:hypothetical protein